MKSSGNGLLSPLGPPLGNLMGSWFTGTLERQMEGSGHGASVMKLIWAPALGSRLYLEPECGGHLELH
jgi:hypothetical protein